MTRKYIRVYDPNPPNKKRDINAITVYLMTRPIDHIEDVEHDLADEYYSNSKAQERDGIIATCDLNDAFVESGKNGHGAVHQHAFYPCATWMREEFRGKGYGVVLYKVCLAIIGNEYNDSRPLFVQHSIGEPGVTTSPMARRVYKSLRRRRFIKKLRTGTYQIKKIPSIKYKKLAA